MSLVVKKNFLNSDFDAIKSMLDEKSFIMLNTSHISVKIYGSCVSWVLILLVYISDKNENSDKLIMLKRVPKRDKSKTKD